MPDEIRFHGVASAYGCFSAFSSHPVFIADTWQTVEHYYQAHKFAVTEARKKIHGAPTPKAAAELGKSTGWRCRQDWEKTKGNVMRTAVWAKVKQHAYVRETLLATGSAKIVEHTAKDSYWGDGGDGSGKNMMGQILMEIRDELTRNGPFDELAGAPLPPWLKFPGNLRSWGGWRQGDGEAYILNWHAWFRGLSEAGKAEIQETYPEPEEWEGFWDRDH